MKKTNNSNKRLKQIIKRKIIILIKIVTGKSKKLKLKK